MTDVPVLIVGGGPAGLTASLLLSRYGVEHQVVTRHATDAPLPRARGIHARAMEILRRVGVESAVRAAELPIRPGAQWSASLAEPPVADHVMGSAAAEEVSPSDGVAIAQDIFEGVLRDQVRAHSAATFRAGVELESFRTTEDGVTSTLRDRATGERDTVRSRYLVAGDGARSGVRHALGIPMVGEHDLGTHLMVAFRADLSPWTTARPRGIYFFTGAVTMALIWTHPDDRWVVHIADVSTSDGLDLADEVRRAIGIEDLSVEVLGHAEWTAAAEQAERYREGPVFLLGDAAHRVPPTGATGVSMAMHDAHNLAWKIAAVLGGRAGQKLLDTYDQERRPVTAIGVEEAGRAWSASTGIARDPFTGRTLRQLDLGYQYRSAAVIDDGSPDADPPGADYEPSGTPGCRAPHVWLAPGLSTLDLFDRDVVLLTSPDGEPWRRAAGAIIVHVLHGQSWLDRYGVSSTGAVLVRPDGHIGWRATHLPQPGQPTVEHQLHHALDAILSR